MSDVGDFGIIGESLPMRRLKAQIVRLAPASVPVLVQGPTGSGKELVAEALHHASGRAGQLIAVNACAIAESMFEDALFGHVRGAFTGATTDVPGYLAEAHRGTVLLDEIGALPSVCQPKLLRAIETRRFRAVGARQDRTSDFRVVAATCDDLAHLVAAGRFRSDLFHRLHGATLVIPPLGERLEDVPLLACHFAGPRDVTTCAVAALRAYHWPGNVRELRQTIELAVVLFPDRPLTAAEVGVVLSASRRSRDGDGDEFLRRRLHAVLEEAGWDTAEAAGLLGVHRATVYRWLRQVGLRPPRGRGSFARIRVSSREFAAKVGDADLHASHNHF